jgi:D-glycero-D-manno-heptose 1,7-bisphosphate phosphatase
MRAVFFDRDGTLMEEVHYCKDPALVRVYPGVPEALARLREAGWGVFVVSNQSGVGRGLITMEECRAVHREFARQVGRIDDAVYCTDAPDVLSTRRKPEPGMVLKLAADYEIDLAASWFVGDKTADIECGRRAGTRTILVLTGYGREQSAHADLVCGDAVEAVSLILSVSH